jgi:penicillin amidase
MPVSRPILPVVLIVSSLAVGGCATILFRPSFPRTDGVIQGLPMGGPVKVIRDRAGIPHIRAGSREDMFTAQGYVHAQDRLFSMELLRRLSQGRLSEMVGPDAVDLDYFVRHIGIPDLRRRAAANLDPEEHRLVQAYVNGINAFLADDANVLPAELRLLGARSEPWAVEDAFGNLALVAWLLQDNYVQELFYLQTRDRIAASEFDLLFPARRGSPPIRERYVDAMAALKIAPLQVSADAFLRRFLSFSAGRGSNLWAVRPPGGGPALLANDTHLSVLTPSLWYINHLTSPETDVAGFTIPGSPGVFIGHNGYIAWGFTTLHADVVDLYVVETDPDRPTRYRAGENWHEMTQTEIVIPLKGGRVVRRPSYSTVYGPVLTELTPGNDAAVCLRWFGTIAAQDLRDRSTRGFLKLAAATTVDEAMAAAPLFAYVTQNMVVADRAGNVARVVLGALPVRSDYSGRYPALGSPGTSRWDGFVPFRDKPAVRNPPEGWIVSANDPVEVRESRYPVSQIWPAPYRYERVTALLGAGAQLTTDAFTAIQLDLQSGLAHEILPTLLAYELAEPAANRALDILRGWDRVMRSDSAGAAVFEVFVQEWMRNLLGDELGDRFDDYLLASADAWSAEDAILSHPESDLWDDIRTAAREGPAEIVEQSLVDAMMWIEQRLGPDPASWQWGSLHTVTFAHPAGTSAALAPLVNRGPFALGGSITTVNVAASQVTPGGFEVIGIPNLRFVIDLADPDDARVVSPPGQSGIPSNPHYDDAIQPWLDGTSLPLPFSPEEVDRTRASVLTLRPLPSAAADP